MEEIDYTGEDVLFPIGTRVKRPENMMKFALSSKDEMEQNPGDFQLKSGVVVKVFRGVDTNFGVDFGPFYRVKWDEEENLQTFVRQGLVFEDDEMNEKIFSHTEESCENCEDCDCGKKENKEKV